MTHARVLRARPAPASFTTFRLLGGLALGGALVFGAGQAVQAASPTPAKATAPANATPPAPACDGGACPWHGSMGSAGGDHAGHGMKGHGGPGMGLPFAGPGFDRLLDDVQATDAQRKQIREITDKARADLRVLHDKAREQHENAMALWTAPKIDPAEAEKQRQQMLAHHDQVSKRMMQAMLDVGQVLTPEQRAKAAVLIKQRHERMKDHMQERMKDRAARPDGAASDAGGERLQNHMLRRPVPPAPPAAPAASQPAPSR